MPQTAKRYFLADGGSRVDLAHLRAGGVDAVVLSVAVGPGPRDAAGVATARKEADAKLARIKALAADHPAAVGIALSTADVERLHRQGRIALIDVSQLSTDALLQTLKLTRAPVAATHSNARGLMDNTRNLSDAELDAIKANGGVVQLTPFASYLHLATEAERAKASVVRVRFGLPAAYEIVYDGGETLAAARREAYLDAASAVAPRATLSEYADHIDYVAKRIGWRHVGIGTDFDHGAGVTGFDSEAEAPNLTAELLKRGYTPDQVVAIWGGDFLRIWRAAEAVRAQ